MDGIVHQLVAGENEIIIDTTVLRRGVVAFRRVGYTA